MDKTRVQQAAKRKQTHRPPIRKLHVNLPEDVHQRLRVRCALEDVTMQEFVARALAELVKDMPVPSLNNGGKVMQ